MAVKEKNKKAEKENKSQALGGKSYKKHHGNIDSRSIPAENEGSEYLDKISTESKEKS